ncbi:zinc ABC transporter substrate-binding protein [Bacillus spongiae]|uniref:Zinc ABC transporter substrate-binding protein n=1 Tax=Bacillus spongiae TaxID=2683610 RepID=A0ABU8HF60_9BACI
MKKKIVLFFVLTAIFIMTACSNTQEKTDGNEKTDGKLTIYTTVFPLKDFSEKIGGDFVHVESIIPLGADAHTFEPTLKQMQDIADADLFLYTTSQLETYAADMKKSLSDNQVTFMETAYGIDTVTSEEEHSEEETHSEEEEAHSEEEGESGHEEHEDQDPHVWLDPLLAIEIAENITASFSELLPEQQSTFEENFQKVKEELLQIDEEMQSTIEESSSKEILVSHAAYGYWERRYGLEQIAISGLSPSNEPSQKELAELISLAKDHNIEYVIFEQNVSSKVSKVIQQELGVEKLYLHNLSVQTKEDANQNEDYFSLMEKNIQTLKTALQ